MAYIVDTEILEKQTIDESNNSQMKLVFFCNYLNHHQIAIADALFELLHDDFQFVATRCSSIQNMKGGEDYSNRSYCFCAEKDAYSMSHAEKLAIDADVALFGAESQRFAVLRAKTRKDGLSFELGERWLKRGLVNLVSPFLLRWLKNYWMYYHRRPFYKLNSSAFAARDHYRMHTYQGRCFKWGYFVEAETEINIAHESPSVNLLWVGRFLQWKHPEMAVQLAHQLRNKGYSIHLDMIGEGPCLSMIQNLRSQLGLEDVVTLMGAQTNRNVRLTMKNHDILLLTSDRNEGWGVVANESMGCGCILVGSDVVGAVPYLVRNRENGVVFESENLDSLVKQVQYLIDNPQQRACIARRGWETMTGIWSPRQAAKNLLQLIDDILHGKSSSLSEGPCSMDIVI